MSLDNVEEQIVSANSLIHIAGSEIDSESTRAKSEEGSPNLNSPVSDEGPNHLFEENRKLRQLVAKHIQRARFTARLEKESAFVDRQRKEERLQAYSRCTLALNALLTTIISVVATIDLFLIPFRIVFRPDDGGYGTAFDLFADFIYVANVAIKFGTPYVQNGILVHKKFHIAKRYITSKSFALDLFTAVPTGVVAWALGLSEYLRINKALVAPVKWWKWLNTENPEDMSSFRLSKSLGPVALLIHTSACAWELVLKSDMKSYHSMTQVSNVQNYSALHRWLLGCDWTVKHMSGYGSTGTFPTSDNQVLLMLCIAVIGALLYAIILATVSAGIVEKAKRNPRDRLVKKLDEVSDALKEIGLPKQYREEIKSYYYYVFKMAGTIGASDILDDLPEQLLDRVRKELGRQTLSKLPLFEGVDDPQMMDDLYSCLVPRVLLPNIKVLNAGEKGEECLFIVSGELLVINETDSLVEVLAAGDRYGEKALLMPFIHSSTITTSTLCTLFVLHKSDFQAVLSSHPYLLDHIASRRKSAAWMTYHASYGFAEPSESGSSSGLGSQGSVILREGSSGMGFFLFQQGDATTMSNIGGERKDKMVNFEERQKRSKSSFSRQSSLSNSRSMISHTDLSQSGFLRQSQSTPPGSCSGSPVHNNNTTPSTCSGSPRLLPKRSLRPPKNARALDDPDDDPVSRSMEDLLAMTPRLRQSTEGSTGSHSRSSVRSVSTRSTAYSNCESLPA